MKITPEVYMLECADRSHVYLVKAKENILIDTGFPGVGEKIIDEIESIGVDPKSITKILLTHHDVDHIGNARFLKSMTGAKLFASKEDIPYIHGEINRPGIKRIVQSIVKYEKPFVDDKYLDKDSFEEIDVIKTPGHTPGHVIFSYKNILFTGDLFKIKDGQISLLPGFMTWNKSELINSLKLLKDLKFEWICPSHGMPIKRNEEWDRFINSI